MFWAAVIQGEPIDGIWGEVLFELAHKSEHEMSLIIISIITKALIYQLF